MTDDIILDYRVAHRIWKKLYNSRYIQIVQDPPFLFQINTDIFDDPPNDSINWWYLTRIIDENYKEAEKWEQIPSKFKFNEMREVYVSKIFDDNDKMRFGDNWYTKLVCHTYTIHGAMITFEFKDIRDGKVDSFMRAPVSRDLFDESKNIMDGNPMFEMFEYQTRDFFQDRQIETPNANEYFHPHYRDVEKRKHHSKGSLMDAFDRYISIIERSARQW